MPSICAYRFLFSSLIAFHTTTMVNAPKSAGKNLTQNTPLPKTFMMSDTQDVNGGTDTYPLAK